MIHIIGGGLQGCFFAIALQSELGISPERIRIYDPHPSLLHNWHQRTANCRMTHLRSNSSHSIHPNFHHLRGYARNCGINLWNSPHFAMPYHRPSLELFNKHAAQCIRDYSLESIHIRTQVQSLLAKGGVVVDGSEMPGRLIYAGGYDQRGMHIPPKLADIPGACHVFSPEFSQMESSRLADAIILGGGISGAQLALNLADKRLFPLLVTHKPLEVFNFDFDPCFIGPKCRPMLDKVENARRGKSARMEKVLSGRCSGTIPMKIHDQIQTKVARGEMGYEIIADNNILRRRLQGNDAHTRARQLIFCTGFEISRGYFPLLKDDTSKFIRGYPAVGRNLQWKPGIYLSGSSALYRLGSSAYNIIGAHLAWRILRSEFAKSR